MSNSKYAITAEERAKVEEAHPWARRIAEDNKDNVYISLRLLMDNKRKLHPATKKAWVKRLRSGDFHQSSGNLCKTSKGRTGYCCLGVLAEVKKIPYTESHRYKDNGTKFIVRSYLRPDFPGRSPLFLDPVILPTDVQKALAGINDARISFKRIASLIDQYL